MSRTSIPPTYIEHYGETMPSEHRKVINAMIHCRTEDTGTVIYQCDACVETQAVHRSCGNRHCPGCQHRNTYQWREKQIARQLPGHHFMLTFTVPEPLRMFLRAHQRIGYGALFGASSGALKTLAADHKFFGTDTPASSGYSTPGDGSCTTIPISTISCQAGRSRSTITVASL